MIRFENVTKQYGNKKALDSINLQIDYGEFISVVGQSGAGKSTLLKLIFAEEQADTGRILIDNVDVSRIAQSQVPYLRRKIGVVFQDIRLLPKMTAAENVAFAMEVAGYSRDRITKDVAKILDIVGVSEKANSFPNEMSGGEQQRVAIARALAHKPVLLVADEPTGNLDEINGNEILNLLHKINSLGTTVILATHARDLVNKVQKRVVTMEKGKVAFDQQHGGYKL